jgi:hypothetical protein
MLGIIINIDDLINEALKIDDSRARNIVVHRFGLEPSKRKKTLAKLGNEYKLTRERIRQIEENTLKSIRERIKGHKEAIKFLEVLEDYFKNVGHIRRGEFVAKDLGIALDRKEPEDEFYNKIHFIASVLEWPHINGENENWYIVWHSKPEVYDLSKKIVDYLLKVEDYDFDKFLKSAVSKFKITEPQIVNHLTASKRFMIGPYGDMGADSWAQVNPKTVRDTIYIVLKENGEPLHFREIAILVNKLSDRKRAPATVHNELIKDQRFTLVGRGTYTLNA